MSGGIRRLDGSFVALRRLVKSFEELEAAGRPAERERSLLRLARGLGKTAVPACIRELSAADDARAEWAYALLLHIADEADDRPRVVSALAELCESAATPDRAVLRALALLDELGEKPPAGARLRDPRGAWQRSLEELGACLAAPAETARVADGLVAGASGDHIADLLYGLARADVRAASALLAEVIDRHELDEPLRLELEQLARQLPAPRWNSARADVRMGRRGARRVIIATAPPGARMVRALCALIDDAGRLSHAHFSERISRAALERDILAPLEEEGYRFARAGQTTARRALSRAARAALKAQGELPRDYYLGRHLAGHRGALAFAELGRRERARALSRARELLGSKAHDRARNLLEGLLDREPRDAEARGSLGLCLLALGQFSESRRELERAVKLDPDQPAHLWNLAAAAHREGRPGACYLALTRFLESDRFASLVDPSIESRRHRARDYIAEYERLARLEHPHTAPATLARAEALYCEARLTLARGDAISTIRALREVVQRVPTHYGAWTHLGMAQGVSGHVDDARTSLERALALRPGDAVACDALRSLGAANGSRTE